jgi:exodeoxyribonuclease V alpha subunit
MDEASMVDLALMAKLLLAVPPGARVLLLGDKDQLASVEAGNVLGDLSSDPELNQFSPEFLGDQAAAGGPPLPVRRLRGFPLADTVIELRRSHRFPEGSGIQQVSAAVNRGDADAALQALSKPAAEAAGGIVGRPLPVRGLLREALRPVVIEAFGSVVRCADAARALSAMNRFRLLAAVREGPYGVLTLNATVVDLLREAGLMEGTGDWFRGRQILITSNDYSVNLFNGDLGIVWPDEQGRPMAWFPGPDGTVRRVSPGRLPAHETAFALTVHKSQGSEFDSVLLILPDRTSRVLTRELVYTGLTRARHRTEVWSVETVLREAIGRRTERASGLRDRLWGGVA